MNCRKVNHLISAYIDGELAGVEVQAIRQHLRQCAECNDEYEGLLQTKRMLARLKVQPPPPNLQGRILENIRNQRGETASHREAAKATLSLSPFAKRWFLGMGVGAVAVLVATSALKDPNEIRWEKVEGGASTTQAPSFAPSLATENASFAPVSNLTERRELNPPARTEEDWLRPSPLPNTPINPKTKPANTSR